jgi:hypothetical protein
MTNYPSRVWWLALLRWALLAFAVLAAAAAATAVGFAAYLFVTGYSGDGDPEGLTSLAFQLSFLVLGVVGLPTTLAGAAAWTGYAAVTRKSRQSSR